VTTDRSDAGQQLGKIDFTVPHSARIWNYWLGGKDNYQVDRVVGDQVAQMFPAIPEAARTSRQFLLRVIRYLARDVGIRQFLDVGTGLPTVNNTHQVAQALAPESRIVYVDNDPLVLAHARALLTSSRRGKTDYIDADLHDSARILADAGKTLDFTKPIALILNGIMGHVSDDDEAYSCVRELVDALPSGSYLALSDGTDTNEAAVRSMELYASSGAVPYHLRSPERIAGFFKGLEMVEPGLVKLEDWRPDAEAPQQSDERHAGRGGVARKHGSAAGLAGPASG
jgi:S-adenosyl methyltransferase